MLSHFMSIKPLEDFAAQLPKSVYAARKLLGKDKDLFTKYACCPSCSESVNWTCCKIIVEYRRVLV